MKLPLSILCALLVVPAWRLYMLPMIVHEGWRFGFVASHATKCLDGSSEKSVNGYLELIKHFATFGEHEVRKASEHGAGREDVSGSGGIPEQLQSAGDVKGKEIVERSNRILENIIARNKGDAGTSYVRLDS